MNRVDTEENIKTTATAFGSAGEGRERESPPGARREKISLWGKECNDKVLVRLL